jgi:23S rRNA pseudouridine2605 synthase
MPRKASKKAGKKAEPEAANLIAASTPSPQHEPDEPELNAASVARLEGVGLHSQGVPPAPTAAPAEAEQLAQAAETFEQAYVDLEPAERHEPIPVDANTPELKKTDAGREDKKARQPEPIAEDTEEFTTTERPARLERLQKILSQAGIASRRHAEEMIAQGRVQVNGKIITELGSKADPERDHIRVDGKLIHGAERLRYFVLNKPRGYVTTVSDPEGRPTVMQFFRKMGERLYPVGRLDYQSEGLLLVTNDGDLANKLTRAATGVEKTYLVKVSGQPSAEELDRLREGVGIDRARPGEGRVHTAPAAIREARPGDNPWYEVVLIEGRNRELRKMFEEIGHHVEKIRRVGYGPLVLDLEPGQFRELEPEELAKLRLAAEGKWRKPIAQGSRAAGASKKPPSASWGGETGRGRRGGRAKEGRHEAAGRPPKRESQPARQRRYDDRGGGRREDRGRISESAGRQRPPQQTRDWRRTETQSEGFQRSRPRVPESEQGFKRGGAWRSQAGKPDRRRQEANRENPRRQDRHGAGSKYQKTPPRFEDRARDRARFEDRPRFEDREAGPGPGQRTGSRPPRSEASQPERFAPSRPGRRDFGTRGEQPARESRGGRAAASRSGGRNAARPNRASGSGGGRPPFKSGSGRSGSSRNRSNPRSGPRRPRD